MATVKSLYLAITLITGLALTSAGAANAQTRAQLDADVEQSLERFYAEIKNGKQLASEAKGLLIFPSIVKAGFGIGG